MSATERVVYLQIRVIISFQSNFTVQQVRKHAIEEVRYRRDAR